VNRIALFAIPLVLALLYGCPRRGGDENLNQNENANDNAVNDNSAANVNNAADENANVNFAVENDNESESGYVAALAPAVWRRTSSQSMRGGGQTDLDYLVLNDDSTANLHFRHPDLGFLLCYDGLFMTTPGVVLLYVSDLLPGGLMAQYELLDDNTLRLFSPEGQSLEFERVAELPDEYRCQDVTVVNTFEELPSPQNQTGLAYDGTHFWYTHWGSGASELQPIDRTTGVAEAPVAAPTPPYVHACQGTHFWFCSGATQIAVRRSPDGAPQDEVDTNADLGTPTEIDVLTYDSDAHRLWLYGRAAATGTYRLLSVESDAEPDVLADVYPLDIDMAAMAWHDGLLWILLDTNPPVVITFDRESLTCPNTYALPPGETNWFGLAWAGDSLYLIGKEAGDGVLLQAQVSP